MVRKAKLKRENCLKEWAAVGFTIVPLPRTCRAFGQLLCKIRILAIILPLRVYILQKAKWSTFKHLLANPALRVWCNNICFFKWQKRTSVPTELIFDFQFSTLQAIQLWSLLPVENKPVFIGNLHTLPEEIIPVQYPAWPRERSETIFCWLFFPQGWLWSIGISQNCTYWQFPSGKARYAYKLLQICCFFAGWKSFLRVTLL